MKYTFYVDAVNGCDSADGNKSAPFKTAGRAFDAARAALATKKPADITLQFKKGAYTTMTPLSLSGKDITAEEYSVTLRGEKGAAIRGTYDIPARLFQKVEGKEYYAYSLPADIRDADGKPPVSCAVFFDGDTRDNAASEYSVTDYNEEPFTDENGKTYFSVFIKEDLLSDMLGAPRESDGKPSLLCNPRMELAIVLSWYFSIVRVVGIDYAHSFGTEAEGCHDGYIALRLADPDGDQFYRNPHYVGKIGDGKHRRFRLYGNLAFLHKAGQYYYDDDAGVIYYYPKADDDMEGGMIGLGICDKLVVFEDMKNITVEGLRLGGTNSNVTKVQGLLTGQSGGMRFRKSNWCNDSAVYAHNVENFTVRNCQVSDVYYDAIAMDGDLTDITIEGCQFKNVGASSICVLAPNCDRPTRNLKIENNYSINSGYVFNNCCGIMISHVDGLSLCHNSIIDSSYSAISVGWTWGLRNDTPESPSANVKNAEIAYNYIENPMIRCFDGGSIYINGGSLDVYKYKYYMNSMHHNFAYCGTPHKGREKCMETSTCLYHDEGTSHWHTHSNVVWADEETLSRFSYVSLQNCGCGVRHILVENNYFLNIKDPNLTCGEGRVVSQWYLRERNSTILYKGKCPDSFTDLPDGMADVINATVLGAGAAGQKNARALNLSGYRCQKVGESERYFMTGHSDELCDNIFQQFDYNERWFHYTHAEVRRLGEKMAEDFSDFEMRLFKEGYQNKAKISFSSINTTVGLEEFGLYDQRTKLENAMKFARMGGCDNIRIYAGLVPECDSPEVYYRDAVLRLRDYVSIAKECAFTLWLCHKRGTAAPTPEIAVRMIEEIGEDCLKIAFQPAECARAGADVLASFAAVRPYLAYIAVTDLDEDGMAVPVGGGTLPYEEMLTQLLSDGYEGFIGLEPCFNKLGGKGMIRANGKNLSLNSPSNAHRINVAYLALKDLMESINAKLGI